MSLRDERTLYPDFFTRAWHIYPNDTDPSIVRQKYGPKAYNFRDIGNVLALMKDGDVCLIHPGSHSTTIAAGIPVTKNNVTIQGVGSNPYSVRIAHGAGTDVAFLVSGAGVTIRNMTFLGADANVKSISSSGAGLLVEDCVFNDCKLAIAFSGANTIVRRCIIDSDNTAAIGIDVGTGGTAASYSVIDDCKLFLSGGTGDTGVKVDNAALRVLIDNCYFHEDCNTAMSKGTQAGNDDTSVARNHEGGQDTADGSLIIT